MLTNKEKDALESLRRGFHIVPENSDYNLMASRRSNLSRYWAKKLLFATFVLNIVSIIFTSMAIGSSLMKPTPKFFASTPSGKVVPLKRLQK